MEFLQNFDHAKFLSYAPRIKQGLKDWKIIEVLLSGNTLYSASFIAKKMKDYFGAAEGVIFKCNSREVLALVNLGSQADINHLAEGLDKTLTGYSCSAIATSLTAEGLLKLQLRLQEQETAREDSQDTSLLAQRQTRAEKIVMVVDDDLFMRSLIVKHFTGRAKVIEHSDIGRVVESYLELLPDLLFLDIHMPGGSGIDVLSELVEFDDTAHVVIISSDRIKDNVLEAKKLGAKGFIGKPFTPEKLESCFQKCPTVSPDAAKAAGS